jgi:penicillin-binding protein 1A
VARVGTAARAQATLKRPDLYGKTGTTNDSVDAWFAGYQPSIAAVSWIGYDTPRNLGSRETGGGLSLPIWINFMQHALKGVPVAEVQTPPGVVNMGGDWYYEENAATAASPASAWKAPDPGNAGPGATQPPAAEERSRILDLFRTKPSQNKKPASRRGRLFIPAP